MSAILNSLDKDLYETYKEVLLSRAVSEGIQGKFSEIILELREELISFDVSNLRNRQSINDAAIKLKVSYKMKAQKVSNQIVTNMPISDIIDATIKTVNKIIDEWKVNKIKDLEGGK